jgi:Zn-dependent protease
MPFMVSQFFQLFILVNVGFFVFNMIPFPPLDGSRLLYAVSPEPVRGFMRQIENFGIIGIVIFIALLFPIISPLFGTVITALMSWLVPNSTLLRL